MQQEIAEVTDAEVRSLLKQQAQQGGKVKLPKAGFTKKLAGGKFGSKQRQRCRAMLLLRKNKARWARGEFTEQELVETRKMLEHFREQFLLPEPTLWEKVTDKLKFWLRKL